MKDYELYSNLKIPKNFNTVLRIDGRNFHHLSQFLNLDKPLDKKFTNLMANVCKDLFNEFAPSFIYTFSDEINILLSNIPFNARVEKLDSVLSSFTSSSFTHHLPKYFHQKIYKPISFDSRIITLNNNDISKYFQWRQKEAWRNCIEGYKTWYCKKNNISPQKTQGLKKKDIHELLYKNGINLNNIENWKKRGIGLYKKQKKITGFNQKKQTPTTSHRNFIYTDFNLPLFSQKFFQKISTTIIY